MNKLKVVVIMGGTSSEREVSLATGMEMIKHLNVDRYEMVKVDFPSEIEKISGADVALIALHGRGGEDGCIQGYLETLGIKYTGCGVMASAIGMNKLIFRRLMESYNLPMAKLTEKAPCVVKPIDGGSSIGVVIVKKQENLLEAVTVAKQYSAGVLIEEYLDGREFSCGIVGDQVLPVIEIKPKNEFFDYEAKYTEGMSQEICPAEIDSKLTSEIQSLTKIVFNAINGRGYARVDFIVKNNRPFILEINTLPGMTPNSLIPKEAKVAGMDYSELLDKIIELGLK